MRVYGIGLSKTGTTSLSAALEILGIESVHNPEDLLSVDSNGKLVIDLEQAEAYPSLTDVPAARFFRELDNCFPGSKFILTTRDQEAWLRSCADHFHRVFGGIVAQRLTEEIYGTTVFDSGLFAKAYEDHFSSVIDYFAGREQDLLILDTAEPDKWRLICDFLNLPVPEEDFPASQCIGKTPPFPEAPA